MSAFDCMECLGQGHGTTYHQYGIDNVGDNTQASPAFFDPVIMRHDVYIDRAENGSRRMRVKLAETPVAKVSICPTLFLF